MILLNIILDISKTGFVLKNSLYIQTRAAPHLWPCLSFIIILFGKSETVQQTFIQVNDRGNDKYKQAEIHKFKHI